MTRTAAAAFGPSLHVFCERLPKDLLWVENPDGKKRVEVVPGQLRDGKVIVGRHKPPTPNNLEAFLVRFESAYSFAGLSKLGARSEGTL